jgi:hypothetical protein
MRDSRRVLLALVAFIVSLVIVNATATVFYHSYGGFGLLDLNGGANLLDSRPPTRRPARTPCSPGTARPDAPDTCCSS